MAGWGYAAVIGAALLAAALVLWQRRQSRKILENLGKMLEAAMEGNFTEASFDESLLSALESSFAHYLAASTVSARKVDAEKEKLKALIGDISHQTKTPIANILLYTQLLKEQPGNRDCLEALEGQTKKLQSLIDALVKTSRLETGVIALHPEPGELWSVMTSAVSQLRPKAAEKGIRITLEHGEANAVFDPKWTEEALYNLLDNAVKYTPSGGRVSVTAVVYPMVRGSPRKSSPRSSSGSIGEQPTGSRRVWALACTWSGRSPRDRGALSRSGPNRAREVPSPSICQENRIFPFC